MKRIAIIAVWICALVTSQLPVGARPRVSEPPGLFGHDLIEAARAWGTLGQCDFELKMTLPGPKPKVAKLRNSASPRFKLNSMLGNKAVAAFRASTEAKNPAMRSLARSIRPDWSRFSVLKLLKPLTSETPLTTTEPVLATLPAAPQSGSCTFYVSGVGTFGTPHGSGSFVDPWTLYTVWNGSSATGIAPPAAIHPDNAVCVRGGTYLGGFYSTLLGTSGHQIKVMAYPGERVTIDGGGVAFNEGGYVTVQNIEMTNSATFRTDYRAGGFAVNAPGIKLINNIIHDGGTGISSNDSGFDDEFYGNVIYNVGWDDRLTGLKQGGTGPGTYFQNATGFKKFNNNIVTNSFGLGISAYTAGNQAHLTGFELQDNISYMNGYWTRYHDTAFATEGSGQWNFLVGSSQTPLENLIFTNNFGYHREQRYVDNFTVGYGTSQNTSATVTGNVSLGGNFAIQRFATITQSGNVAAWNQPFFYYTSASSPVSEGVNNNSYYYYPTSCGGTPNFISHDGGSTYISIATWKGFGYDAASTFAPCGTRPPPTVTIKTNIYDANRFHVIVVNPSSVTNVTLNFSSALSNGDTFELRNAQDPFGPVVASGTYSAPITINMTTLTVATPVGYSGLTNVTPLSLMTSGPQFGTFLLLRNTSAVVTQPLTSPPTGVTAAAGNNQVTISFNALNGATGYNVYRRLMSGSYNFSSPLNGGTPISSTTYVDATAQNNSAYGYEIKGVNSVGEGPASGEVTATPQSGVPAAPTNLVITNITNPPAITTTDSFTGADGTDLRSHVGELGAVWNQPSYSQSSRDLIFSNRLTHEAVGFRNIYYSSGTPAVNSYVQANFTVMSAVGAGGLTNRLDPASENYYSGVYDFATGLWSVNSNLNGTTAQLGSVAQTLTVGNSYAVKLQTSGNTEILYVDGSALITVTNADHPGAGRAGILMSGVTSSTTGFAIDSFEAGSLGSSLVRATFQDNANNETGSSLLRGVGATPSSYVQVAAGAPDVTTLDDTTAQPGVLYSYYVVMFNGSGNSAPTATVTNATLPATPTNLTSAVVSATQINLSWTSTVGLYSVEQCPGLSCSNFVEVFTPSSASQNVTGLTANSPYSWRVRSKNSAGYSSYSNTVSATTSATPTPSAPTGPAAAAGNASVTLTWTATANTLGYKIFRRTALTSYNYAAPIATPGTNSFVDTGLTNGVQVFYEMRSSNASGDSVSSSEVSATPVAPITPPAAPIISITVGNANVVLNWPAVATATGYKVYLSTTSGVYGAALASPTANTYTASGLTNGTPYFLVVTATNSAGEGVISNEVSGTPATVPPAPTGVATVSISGQVTVSWSASAGATTYKLFRATTSGGYNFASPLVTQAGLSYADATAVNGTIYFYLVRAVNAQGDSLSSPEVTGNPPGTVTAPSNLTDGIPTENSIPWTWANNGIYNEVHFEACAGAGCTNFVEVYNLGLVTSKNYTGLNSSTTVSVRLRGKLGGVFSNYSAIATATTTVGTPSTLVATANGPNRISLTWTPNSNSNAVNFSTCVERKLTSGGTFEQMACSGSILSTFIDDSVVPNTDYTYRIQNRDVTGPGLYSNTANAVTLAPPSSVPGTPTNFRAHRVSSTSIEVSWTLALPRNETGIKVEKSTDNVNWTLVTTTGANVQGYTLTGLAIQTTFYLRARATNGQGDSGNSNVDVATTVLICDVSKVPRCQ